jgi:hypothetical protein
MASRYELEAHRVVVAWPPILIEKQNQKSHLTLPTALLNEPTIRFFAAFYGMARLVSCFFLNSFRGGAFSPLVIGWCWYLSGLALSALSPEPERA